MANGKINIPLEFTRFCKENDIEDRNDTREIAILAWNSAIERVIGVIARNLDNKADFKEIRKECTIVEQYPHPDFIAMVNRTKVKEFGTIDEMIDDIQNRYRIDKAIIRCGYKDFIDGFEDGDVIIEYDDIGILCGSRGYALSRNGEIIDGITTARA